MADNFKIIYKILSQLEKDMDKLVQRMTEHGGNVFVIPNYTTMLEIHGRLAALCGTEQFWEK